LDYGAKKLPTLTELGTFCNHIFKIIFAIFLFMVRFIDSTEVKTVLLFRFFNFHSIIWSELDKMFEDKKIQFTTTAMGANITWLQNMSSFVSQLCSRVAGGEPLENSYVLDNLCNTFWQNTYLSHSLLTWVQNGPVGFGYNIPHVKNSTCAE
jgi:hypothetical protein